MMTKLQRMQIKLVKLQSKTILTNDQCLSEMWTFRPTTHSSLNTSRSAATSSESQSKKIQTLSDLSGKF